MKINPAETNGPIGSRCEKHKCSEFSEASVCIDKEGLAHLELLDSTSVVSKH